MTHTTAVINENNKIAKFESSKSFISIGGPVPLPFVVGVNSANFSMIEMLFFGCVSKVQVTYGMAK